jgi:hypothetical protein
MAAHPAAKAEGRGDAQGATFDELTEALRETLNRRGSLRRIRSSLRAEAFAALQLAGESNSAEEQQQQQQQGPPSSGSDAICEGRLGLHDIPLRPENALINELIREYLEFNGHRGTASVLEVEAGGGIADAGASGDDGDAGLLCREMMKIELGVTENGENGRKRDSSVPLLYGIVEALKRKKNG